MIPLFDLHCDTLFEIYRRNENIKSNDLHISFEKACTFSPYSQVFAIWSDASLSNDEAYERYNKILEYSKKQINFTTQIDIEKERNFILSVEDARLLNNDLSRLYKLFSDGVRILTLNWKGISIIGGGWDTNEGLTKFGKDLVKECFEYGIIPDVSHSSTKTINDVLTLASQYNKPIIASHSNSYSVCNHKRNISDEHFKYLIESNSIVGISLVPEHLSNSEYATLNDILRHIDYFLNLGGENAISLGCDFDGVSSLPQNISTISDLPLVYQQIEKSFGNILVKKIFFENAFNFMKKNLK